MHDDVIFPVLRASLLSLLPFLFMDWRPFEKVAADGGFIRLSGSSTKNGTYAIALYASQADPSRGSGAYTVEQEGQKELKHEKAEARSLIALGVYFDSTEKRRVRLVRTIE